MPTENKPVEPGFDLNTPDGGRGYIAHLLKTVLKHHDYRHYINGWRGRLLPGHSVCTRRSRGAGEPMIALGWFAYVYCYKRPQR